MPFIYDCDCDCDEQVGSGGTANVEAMTDEEIEAICESVTAYTVVGEAKLGTTMI